MTPSKGKRSKKRKRLEAKLKDGGEQGSDIPPLPEISASVVVGLNRVTRHLESLSRSSKPFSLPGGKPDTSTGFDGDESREKVGEFIGEHLSSSISSVDTSMNRHFSAIFVPQSSQPAILQAHLPQAIVTASLVHPQLPATRLVQLPRNSEARLSEALGLPRVSFVGILEGAAHTKALMGLVLEYVPKIEIPWLKEIGTSTYLPVKINAIETVAPINTKVLPVA